MKKQKVLLISSNAESVPSPVYPLALACLAGAARRAGWESIQYDVLADGLEGLEAFVRDSDPSVVGVSIRNIDNTDASAPAACLAEHKTVVDILRASTDAPVVAGGSGFSIFPKALMEKTGADYGIVGAGEGQFIRLLEGFAEACKSPERGGLIEDPGARSLFVRPQHDPRLVEHYWNAGGMIGIQTKRGCPRCCSYCTYPVIEGSNVAFKDPVQVVDEIEELVRDHGVTYFFFVDSVFNLSRDHEEAIAREILRRGLEISWGAFFSPKNLDRDYLRVMKASGLSHVELGADSFNDGMLERYRKSFNAEGALCAARDCRLEGVNCAVYLVFGGPGETAASVLETVEKAGELTGTVFLPFAGVRVYPNTALLETAREKGAALDCDLVEPVFYIEEGLDCAGIYEIVETAAKPRRNWILPADYSGYAGVITFLRKLGHKGPLWDYVPGKASAAARLG